MLPRFIVAMVVVSFGLGFVKPQFSDQTHLIISLATYLFVWAVINAYEKRRPQPQTQLLLPLFWLIVTLGILSLLAELLPSIAPHALFVRAFVFLGGLVYCFSSKFRLFANGLASRLNTR